MPPRGLPGNANLEQLKNGAKSFARAVRSGDAGAAEVVREFHPRLADAEPGSPELKEFTHADALLVVARRFDFESWPKLKSFLESTQELARSPHHANAYFAFGHDHVGLAMGAITGKLVGELVAGRPTSVDLAPYRVDRF